MEMYVLGKSDVLEFSPKFLSKKMIDTVLKLDVSGLSPEVSGVAAKELSAISVERLRGTLKRKEMKFEPEDVRFDGVSVAKNESVESIVGKVFKHFEKDKDIGRETIAARLSAAAPPIRMAKGSATKPPELPVAKQVDAFMASASCSALQVVREAMSAPVDELVDHTNQNSMQLARTIRGGKVRYMIGDESVLAYKVSLMSKSTGQIIDIVIKWVSVIFDIFSIIASLIGVIIAAIPKETFRKMTQLVLQAWNKLKDVFQALGKSVNESSKILDKAKKAFAIFNGVRKFIGKIVTFGSLLFKAVKIYLFNLRWWEVLICVVSFIASLVILLATDGVGIIPRLLVLGAQFAILTTDVASAVIATV